jgi:hypothetical protein
MGSKTYGVHLPNFFLDGSGMAMIRILGDIYISYLLEITINSMNNVQGT